MKKIITILASALALAFASLSFTSCGGETIGPKDTWCTSDISIGKEGSTTKSTVTCKVFYSEEGKTYDNMSSEAKGYFKDGKIEPGLTIIISGDNEAISDILGQNCFYVHTFPKGVEDTTDDSVKDLKIKANDALWNVTYLARLSDFTKDQSTGLPDELKRSGYTRVENFKEGFSLKSIALNLLEAWLDK